MKSGRSKFGLKIFEKKIKMFVQKNDLLIDKINKLSYKNEQSAIIIFLFVRANCHIKTNHQ
jgi:hypothetical protein